MTNEEKRLLLLKDLSARLPYDVVIHCTDNDTDYKCFLTTDILNEILHNIEYYDYKPYLRPLSNMTNEERRYCLKFGSVGMDENDKVFDVYPFGMERNIAVTDFLNAHHFDYRRLIEKELALEAPDDMYDGSK